MSESESSPLSPLDLNEDEQNDFDTYIEIELEPTNKEDDDEEEEEFRISFSTARRKSFSAGNMFYSSDASVFPSSWNRLELDQDFQSNEFYAQTPTIQTRKASKAKGGVMKMLVKLRSVSFRSILRVGKIRSKLLEIKLEGVRKLFGVVGIKTAKKQTKSCPNSPFQEKKLYSRQNSVQAAIAHCKKSFGQSDDFCFYTHV